MLELAAQRGILHHEASALLQEIVELTDLRAGDVMAPRVDMAAYDVDGPAEGLLELFRTTHLRRIPVYEKDVDHVLGVVPAKRLLLGDPRPLRQLVEKTPFVPEAANLERVLVLFRVTRTQMAIVVDEYGGTAGVVSMQDVLEEIVGDLPDPYEAPHGPAVERISEREYRLDGDLAIHDWADVFGMDLSGKRISTIGGFILSRLGHIPRVGESVDYRNLRFTVLSMRGRRIEKAALELREEAK
jgi:CBS domain containing-hemolysin-like protein